MWLTLSLPVQAGHCKYQPRGQPIRSSSTPAEGGGLLFLEGLEWRGATDGMGTGVRYLPRHIATTNIQWHDGKTIATLQYKVDFN